MKMCSKCKQVVARSNHSWCKSCLAKSNREWYDKNVAVLSPNEISKYNKNRALTSKYKITLQQYEQMLLEQDYQCKICSTTTPGGMGNMFVVDHNHLTGKVRGLLCFSCNCGIGSLKESITNLQKAIIYLESI